MKNYLENIDIEQLKSLAKEQKSLTYAELCRVIGMEPVTSNSKTAQIKQLSQICSFEKEKTHYKIKEYYTNPTITEDRKQKYQRYFEAIILCSLSKGQSKIVSPNELREWLGLCNQNFKLLGKPGNRAKIAVASGFKGTDLSKMYAKCVQYFDWNIGNCLKSMQKHGYITVQKGYRLFQDKDGIIFKQNIFQENPEYSRLVEIEKTVLTTLRDNGEIYVSKNGYITRKTDKSKYWKECNAVVRKKFNILGYCSVKKIALCVKHREGNIKTYSAALNEIISENLLGKLHDVKSSAEFIDGFIRVSWKKIPDYTRMLETGDEEYLIFDKDDMAAWAENYEFGQINDINYIKYDYIVKMS